MNQPDEKLEMELKTALARREASPDFINQVMRRVAEIEPASPGLIERLRHRVQGFLQIPAMRFAATAVTVCLVFGVAFGVRQFYQEQRVRREGEIARMQVLLALQITSFKLNQAREKVNQGEDRGADADDSSRKTSGVEKLKD